MYIKMVNYQGRDLIVVSYDEDEDGIIEVVGYDFDMDGEIDKYDRA